MRLITSLAVVLFSIIFANSGGPGGNYANNAPWYYNCTSCHSGNVNSGNGSVAIAGLPNEGYIPGETYILTLSVTGTHDRGYGFQMASQVGNDNAGTFSLGANSQNAELTGNRVQHSTRTISGEWIVEWLAPASDVGDVIFSFSGLATGGNSGFGGDNVYTGSVQVSAADVITAFQPESKQELVTAVNLWVSDNVAALSTYGEINEWDVSLISDMSDLFYNLNLFNEDISSWDVSNVTNMEYMFDGAENFNSDIGNWNVLNVSSMGSMFRGAISFNQDISSWNVSSVVDIYDMFHGAASFNTDLSSWDVSNVMNMGDMFRGAISFNQDISSWDVSNVLNMNSMFREATSFNQDLSSWDVSSVTDMAGMFSNAIIFNQDISNWDVSNVADDGWDGIFDNTISLSDNNKCEIHTSFSSNIYWPYDWSASCALTVNELLVSPRYFKLHQNYPNPFNPVTKIHYDLPKNSFVSIDVFDVMGNKIKSLVNSVQDAGYRSVYWDATNNLGQAVSAGMYIYTVNSGEFRATRKMALIK